MQLNSEVVTTPPRASATVVLLRDDLQKGMQVFLLRRHTASAVLGGAYVFPGGKLDDADCSPQILARLDASPEVLHRALGEPELPPDRAAGLYVAAVREVLEECGVLFVHAHTSTHPGLGAQRQQLEMQKQMQHQMQRGQNFATLLEQQALTLCTTALAPWSRWITPYQPSVSNRRFDTRFFVAVLPQDQTPTHDNLEAIDSVWLTPREALTQYWAGDLPLAPPQIMTLSSLMPHTQTGRVLDAARQQTPPLIFPETFEDEGGRHMCYPGDPRHSIAQRAMRGPTRLRFVAGRFEPRGGFEEFL